MQGKDPDKFDIRFDDTPPEPVDPAEVDAPRFDRLNRRITLVALLVPSLLGLGLAAAYLDLKNRVVQIDSSGTTEVKKVSQDLESTFSSLSVQVAKMDEDFSSRLDALEKAVSSDGGRLKNVESRLERLDKTKAEKSVLASALKERKQAADRREEKIDETLSGLQAEWERVGRQIESSRQAGEQAARRIEAAETEIKALEAEVAALSGLRPDLRVLELAVKNDREALFQSLERTTKDLEARIEALSRRLTDLSRKAAVERQQPRVKPPPAESSPAREPSAPAPPPESGKIIEQDIK